MHSSAVDVGPRGYCSVHICAHCTRRRDWIPCGESNVTHGVASTNLVICKFTHFISPKSKMLLVIMVQNLQIAPDVIHAYYNNKKKETYLNFVIIIIIFFISVL